MSGTALFECGCSVGDLDPHLTKNGLCIPTNVVLTSVRYGGVISTACHGPGVNQPSISDFVIEMTVISYDGKSVVEKTYTKVSEENESPFIVYQVDGDLFNAMQAGLGSFGVIYSFKLHLPPMTYLEMEDSVVPLDTALNPLFLKLLHETNKYVELFWWPFTTEVWIKTWNPTLKNPEECKLKDSWSDFTQSLSSDFGVFLLELVEKFPNKTPTFCKGIWELAKHTVINNGGMNPKAIFTDCGRKECYRYAPRIALPKVYRHDSVP